MKGQITYEYLIKNLPIELLRILVNNGLMDSFIRYCNLDNHSVDNRESDTFDCLNEDILYNAFCWGQTAEGESFWADVHEVYMKEVKRNEKKIKEE